MSDLPRWSVRFGNMRKEQTTSIEVYAADAAKAKVMAQSVARQLGESRPVTSVALVSVGVEAQ